MDNTCIQKLFTTNIVMMFEKHLDTKCILLMSLIKYNIFITLRPRGTEPSTSSFSLAKLALLAHQRNHDRIAQVGRTKLNDATALQNGIVVVKPVIKRRNDVAAVARIDDAHRIRQPKGRLGPRARARVEVVAHRLPTAPLARRVHIHRTLHHMVHLDRRPPTHHSLRRTEQIEPRVKLPHVRVVDARNANFIVLHDRVLIRLAKPRLLRHPEFELVKGLNRLCRHNTNNHTNIFISILLINCVT